MRIEATVYKRSIGFSKVYDFPLEEDYEEVYPTNYGYLAWLNCC